MVQGWVPAAMAQWWWGAAGLVVERWWGAAGLVAQRWWWGAAGLVVQTLDTCCYMEIRDKVPDVMSANHKSKDVCFV